MAPSRAEVIKSFRGQEIRLPNISPVFAHWPLAQNPLYEKLVPLVDERLELVVTDQAKISKLKQYDFGLFVCLVWPFLDMEDLYVMACFTVWLFLWDDEIDDSTGSLESDFNGAQRYRATTLAFVEQSIGLRDHGLVEDQLNPLIGSFATLGNAVRERYDLSQKQVLLDEITTFVLATEAEQKIKHADQVWDTDTYWHYRLGTSGVGVFSALVEFTMNESLPRHLFQSKGLKTVWHEINMVVSMSNDLFSLKKELSKGGVDSIVPVACASGMGIQAAVDKTVSDMKFSVTRIDTEVNTTLEEIKRNALASYDTLGDSHDISGTTDAHLFTPGIGETWKPQVFEKFVRCHYFICTGITHWSYVTNRYGLRSCRRDMDGTIYIDL